MALANEDKKYRCYLFFSSVQVRDMLFAWLVFSWTNFSATAAIEKETSSDVLSSQNRFFRPDNFMSKLSTNGSSYGSFSSKMSADLDDPKTLNVHVVPHTHDDVGWLKTVDQYYFGQNMSIQHACVEDILDSVVSSLTENQSRTFTYVEQKFFSMWWKRQDDAVKDTVRFLVANKQLNFVNGGWCMHDEASTHFIGMIDQTTLGHRFLKRELGVIPKVGWQLDPFGHSATQASLFASKVGFDALFFGRIDYQDLSTRHYRQECEGLWNSSQNIPNSTVFWGLTGSYEGNYGAPQGYCFDINCNDPLLTHMNLTALEKSMHRLLGLLRVQSDRTKGSHVMLTMGSDFQYQRAHINYANVDLMISTLMELQRLNKIDIRTILGPRFEQVKIFYSSPDYYTECKHKELTARWSSPRGHLREGQQEEARGVKSLSVKIDDFMPYSDCEHCFWTGYFVSRAGLKRLERVASSFLLSARQIDSMLELSGNQDLTMCKDGIDELEDASGVSQHHDGVSGTAKQHVANDYAKRLQSGIDVVSKCISKKIKQLLLGDNVTDFLNDFEFCPLLNETKCEVAENATTSNTTDLYVVVYNGLAQARSSTIFLPVSTPSLYTVKKIETGPHHLQNVVAIPVSDGIDRAPYTIAFNTGVLPPLGACVFKISIASSKESIRDAAAMTGPSVSTTSRKLNGDKASEFTASNGLYSVTFDSVTGSIKQMTMRNSTMKIRSTWGYYTSFDSEYDATEGDSRDTQNSGAYIFRPSTPDQEMHIIQPIAAQFVNTTVGIEVHTEFQVPWIKTVTRVLVDQPHLEVEYTIGPIPIEDQRGKEIITRFSTPIQSNGTFYTDSNGREFMKRVRNQRSTWDLNVYEPVAGNYYPVNAACFIQDEHGKALSIATDRSQGGTSLMDGTLELMVQRRTLADDARGVGEAINETDGGMTPYPPYGNATRIGQGVVIKGKHLIKIGGEGGAALARSMMDQAFVDPLVFVGSAPMGTNLPFVEPKINGLPVELPANIMMVTRTLLYGEKEPSLLLRLAHQYGRGEDEEFSKTVEVDLASCVPGYEITGVRELTLSANQDFSSWIERRIDWAGEGLIHDYGHTFKQSKSKSIATKVTLTPMDIRTFQVMVKTF